MLLRFIHYLASSANLLRANYGPLALARLQELWLSQNYAVKMLPYFTNSERQAHRFYFPPTRGGASNTPQSKAISTSKKPVLSSGDAAPGLN